MRSIAHGLGLRYRLHVRSLPGSPDLVLPKWRTVIFVHGCFWHRHRCKKGASVPTTRRDFWQAKFRANMQRDVHARRALRAAGWRVVVIWECECSKPHVILRRLTRLFGTRSETAGDRA